MIRNDTQIARTTNGKVSPLNQPSRSQPPRKKARSTALLPKTIFARSRKWRSLRQKRKWRPGMTRRKAERRKDARARQRKAESGSWIWRVPESGWVEWRSGKDDWICFGTGKRSRAGEISLHYKSHLISQECDSRLIPPEYHFYNKHVYISGNRHGRSAIVVTYDPRWFSKKQMLFFQMHFCE